MTSTTIDELRNRDLVEILTQLAERDLKGDKNNWRTDQGGRISIAKDRFKWYDHGNQKGGAGAIDLVMHLKKFEFKQAAEWLLGFTPTLEESKLIKQNKTIRSEPSTVPIPHYQNWPKVLHYLTEKRAISKELVDDLHKQGLVYADRYENAVFLNYNRTGAELRGTQGNFHGYRGKKEAFLITGDHRLFGMAFCESAIDAMSYRDLGFQGTIVSYGGQPMTKMVEVVKENRAKFPDIKVIAAFDADPVGQSFAAQLQAQVPEVRKHIPEYKDWNEQLIAERQKNELGFKI